MSGAASPLQQGPISRSLNETARMLRLDAKAAAAKARDLVDRYPGQREALTLFVTAHRLTGDLLSARTVLLAMTEAQPGVAAVHYELGLLLSEAGEREDAIAALSRAVALEPRHVEAWRALGDALAGSGNATEANKAYAKRIEFSAARLERLETETYGERSRLSRAEQMLRGRLARDPTDVSALLLLGSVYMRLERHAEAAEQLVRARRLAPECAAAAP